MIVLSLFGGAEQGFATLKEMKITPTRYFSSEVDPYAIKLAKANFPDILHIGDVKYIHFERSDTHAVNEYGEYTEEVIGREHTLWTMENAYDFGESGEIDFLIGGPPCQDLSIAGKRAGLDGAKSSLFWEYVRILNETKPRAFFMENVASMPAEAKATITEALFGIEPMRIDSRLTSSQTRKRLYWFGVRQPDGTYKGIDIPQPQDRGILLKDILEDIPFDAVDKKGEPIWKPVPEKYISSINERIERNATILGHIGTNSQGNRIKNISSKAFAITANSGGLAGPSANLVIGQKSYALTATYGNVCTLTANIKKNGHEIICANTKMHNIQLREDGKVCTLTASMYKEPPKVIVGQFRRGSTLRIHAEQEKVCTLTANMGTGGNNVPIIIDSQYYWRKLTVRECARAQSFPEWYSFDSISASRAYKAIGNSWEGGAIKHIWKYLLSYV